MTPPTPHPPRRRPGQEVTPAAGVGVRGQLLMLPCTPGACWVGPGRVRGRPPPRRSRRRWSSWCRPCCRDRRCSEEDFYCGGEEHTTYWVCASASNRKLIRFRLFIWQQSDECWTTHSLMMSSSVNGTSSISTADFALKKIPSNAWNTTEWVNMRPEDPAQDPAA